MCELHLCLYFPSTYYIITTFPYHMAHKVTAQPPNGCEVTCINFVVTESTVHMVLQYTCRSLLELQCYLCSEQTHAQTSGLFQSLSGEISTDREKGSNNMTALIFCHLLKYLDKRKEGEMNGGDMPSDYSH